ncbi:hypothetical protein CU098_002221, partial [Rhizopus stolonifer]
MLHLVNQRFDVVTPERSRPSSPSLSPAVVTHTVATSHPTQRRSWEASSSSSVDLNELSKLLQQNPRPRPRSQLFQSSKPPSPTLSTNSAEPTFCSNASKNAVVPILSQQQRRPSLIHRSSSTCSTPSQFVFKKPEYDEKYLQTHFHRPNSQERSKDLFLAWSDLKRFFVQQQPSSPTGSVHSHESETFAN